MISLALAWNMMLLPEPAPSAYDVWVQDQKQTAAQQKAADKAEKQHQQDIADDIKLGGEIEKEALKELKLSSDKAGLERIERIGGDISKIANQAPVDVSWGDKRLNPFTYKFHLVQGKDVNAFSLPGGTIFVYEGLLKYVESDDELAGVLAHEISHAAFRHVATLRREQSKIEAFTIPLILISILAKSEATPGVAALGTLFGQAKGSGWSVDAEQAADYGGIQYMLKSKYNPAGMLSFMERLAYDERNNGTANIDFGIFTTHPPTKQRAQSCLRHLNDANIAIKRSEVSSSVAFSGHANDDGTATLMFGSDRLVTLAGTQPLLRAQAICHTMNDYFDRVPGLYDLQLNQGIFFGANRMLFKLEPADARFANKKEAELANDTLKNLKRALYELNARVKAAY